MHEIPNLCVLGWSCNVKFFELEEIMLQGSIKKFSVVGLLLSLVGVAYSATIAPLYFENLANTTVEDSVAQQNRWEALMKFKLWGTHSLDFSNNTVSIADDVGYNGTADGDLLMYFNRHHIGGPTLVGGSFTFVNSDHDTLSAGPVRILGDLQVSTQDSNVMQGDWCVKGNIIDQYNPTNPNAAATNVGKWANLVTGNVYNDGLAGGDTNTVYSKCPSTVPESDSSMAVPEWPEPASWDPYDEILMTSDYANEVAFIHVPPDSVKTNDYGTYDLYIKNLRISGNKGKVLYILMPPGGKLTRIYSKNGYTFDNGPNDLKIVVAYAKDSLHFDTTSMKWDIKMPETNAYGQPENGHDWVFNDGDKFKVLTNKEYAGNLLFYTKENIEWNYWVDASFQGSWISKGKITVGGHFKLAGQVIANDLTFKADIKGDFRYVPFDPPILNIDPELLENGAFPEYGLDEVVPISLDSATNTTVKFNYCFDLNPSLSTADRADFNSTAKAPLPLCDWNDTTWYYTYDTDGITVLDSSVVSVELKHDSGYVEIPSGRLVPLDAFKVYLNVKPDGNDEDDEFLHMKIFNLAGAVLPGNLLEGHFSLKIVDITAPPISKDTVVTGLEDAPYTFKLEDFPYTSSRNFAEIGVIVSTLPDKGSLTYKDGAVAEGQFIPADSVGDLKYVGVPDDFGDAVTSFLFQVRDSLNATSAAATMTVSLAAANDGPSAVASTYMIPENSDVGKNATGNLTITDIDDTAFVYSLVSGDTAIFQINATTGIISVKKAVLDYETKASYTVTVHVRDMSMTTGNLADTLSYDVPVTIIVKDVNEAPTIEETVFAIDENSANGDSVGVVVASDLDTAAAFRILTYTIIEPEVPFMMDSATIRVKDSTKLNYETNPEFTFHVVVTDQDGLADTALITVKLNDVNEPPHFGDDLPTLTVDENAPANTVVDGGPVTAEDVDGTETLVYSIIDPTNTFKIDSLTGDVKVIADSTIDYETKATYTVQVVVTDKEGLKDTASITIKVKDVNEPPTIEESVFAVDENSSEGDSVGVVVASDLDTASEFRILTYSIIENDVPFVMDSATIRVKDSTKLNFETTPEFTFHVVVTDQDGLSDTALITVKLNDVNEPPVFTDDKPTLTVDENVPAGTEVGPVTATDVDEGDSLTYSIKDPTDTFVIDSVTGMVTVKADSTIDYETKNVYTVTVIVTDKDGLTDTAIVTIKVNDLNEAPEMDDQELTVAEDKGVGDTVGTVIATDPDVLNPDFGTLTYTLVEESELFDLKKDGTVVLKDTLDYESGDSVFVIKVRVTDGELSDTALVTIRVTNKEEWTDVKITRAETRDSVWLDPDTIFINTTNLCVEWKADGKLKGPDCEENLHEGENIIIKEWKNPTKDYPGYDTLVVYVSTASPEVKVTKIVDASQKPNIFTIVEKQAKSDSSFYVNDTKNDIQVLVRDPVSGEKDSFVVKLDLDTLNIPSKTFTKTLDGFVDAKITLNDKPSSGVTYTPMNGGKTAVSYTEKVGGKEVTVTYYTDEKGKVIKNDDGVKVMTVTYETKVGDQVVKISYQVDAKTGEMVKSSGGYASNDSSASSSKKADEPEVAFTVSYDYVDEAGNTVTVTYGVDEKGNLVRDGSGNLGYEVGYTYTNKYGNTATQSVFIVLDLVPPKVEILSPLEGDIIYSNYVDVKWTVDIGDGRGAIVQDTLITQGLEKGGNVIVRFYRDKAGNEASDTIRVIMKNAKDVDISVEKPVTIVTREKVEEYYAANEPEKGETFAVTIYNTKTDKEVETMVGGEFDAKEGSGDEPYPGLTGHLGPTLGIDTKVPTVNAVGGLATLDDLLNSDGVIPMEGVDAEGSVKLTTDEYVERFCSDEFAEQVGSDISKANLFKTSMRVKIWIYTSLGQFVDYYSFTQDLDNPDYVNDAGMLTLYFEMKPDRDGNVRTDNGRLYATGAYVYKTEVELKSTLRCSLPPFDVSSTGEIKGVKKESNAKGSVRTTKEDLLKSFGYKRPKMKKK